jgi:hypothetical protein
MRASLTAVLLAMLITQAGCEETHDSLTGKAIGKLEQMIKIAESMKDDASVRAAQPKLEKLSAEAQVLREQYEKLGPPDAATKAKLTRKYQDRVRKLEEKFLMEMMRVNRIRVTGW